MKNKPDPTLMRLSVVTAALLVISFVPWATFPMNEAVTRTLSTGTLLDSFTRHLGDVTLNGWSGALSVVGVPLWVFTCIPPFSLGVAWIAHAGLISYPRRAQFCVLLVPFAAASFLLLLTSNTVGASIGAGLFLTWIGLATSVGLCLAPPPKHAPRRARNAKRDEDAD